MVKQEYCIKKKEARFEYVWDNFYRMEDVIKAKEESLVCFILNERACKKKSSMEEVGVRIRTSRDFYSVTEEEAIERVMISENIKNGTLSKEMIEDTSDADMIRQMLFSINLLKNEYKILECHIHGLSMANKEILLPYVNKKTNLERLSKKLCIEPDSVKQRIYRIKKQLKETVFLYMKDYEEGDF